jgi:hypothetical protein
VIEQNDAATAGKRLQRMFDWLTIGIEMLTGAAGVAAAPGIYSGEPGYEFLPVVRRAATAVRNACCDSCDGPPTEA